MAVAEPGEGPLGLDLRTPTTLVDRVVERHGSSLACSALT
jgi:hypothetical protein